jgi:membrane fusion protein, multidrug efflux system
MFLLSSCGQDPGKKPGGANQGPGAPATVLAAEAVRQSVPVQLAAIGAVEAINTVAIKAQVAGRLEAVHFREGEHVGQGAPLFTIDPKPFTVAVNQASAVLERDLAQAELARKIAERSKILNQKDVLSKEEYERDRAAADALAAAVRADRASLEQARLNLSYCDLAAPVAGVAGKLQVTVGNLIPANTLTLVTINQIAPIYVTFSVPQQRLAEIKKYMAQGTLPITAAIPGEPTLETGTLTFVDNAVDPATGAILLKATCPNAAERLWPGQYVDVALTLTSLPDAVVIPTKAVLTGQKGPYVFVIKSDDTVDAQPVTPGIVVGDLTVIPEGIEPGQKVVVSGQLRLTPGAKITIKSPEDNPGPAKP